MSGAITKQSKRKYCLISFIYQQRKLSLHPKKIPWLANSRLYQRGTRAERPISWKSRMWIAFRGVFIATGGLVWLVLIVGYFALDRITVDILDSDKNMGAYALQKKLSEHFFKETDAEAILVKDNALENIWHKLSEEERIKEIFGQPVFICGYNYVQGKEDVERLQKSFSKIKIEDSEMTNSTDDFETSVRASVWEAECYVQGPKTLGQMKVVFEKLNNDWVPVSLHLETLDKTGLVVSNVSSSLPNGIKNFTRLSNL